MTAPRPPQPPVMQLIEQRRGRLSIRKAAASAGISESRWRQLESGARSTPLGYAPESAPPDTLARMAYAVGVTADDLRAAGHPDAAAILAEYATAQAAIAEADEEAATAGARAAAEMRGLNARQRTALAAMIAEDLRTLRSGNDLMQSHAGPFAACEPFVTLGRLFLMPGAVRPGGGEADVKLAKGAAAVTVIAAVAYLRWGVIPAKSAYAAGRAIGRMQGARTEAARRGEPVPPEGPESVGSSR